MRKIAVITVAATLAVVTASTATAAATLATVAGTTKDVVVSTTVNKPLSSSGGVNTTIASVALPAGQWVLSLNATLVNFGPSDYTRCFLWQDNTPLGGATATVGDPTSPGNVGPASLVSTVAFTYGRKLAAPATISVQCSHDSTNGSTPYVDSTASLIAHKSAALLTLFQ